MLCEKVEVLPGHCCKEAEMAIEIVHSISFLDYVAEHYLAIIRVVNDHYFTTTNCSNYVHEDWLEDYSYHAPGGKPVVVSVVICGVFVHPH